MSGENKAKALAKHLDGIYSSCGSLETTCCRQCTCCRVACPQMKFCEASQILSDVFNNWPKKDKAEFLLQCVRLFFSKSLVKPCPLLHGNQCRTYAHRPLNCRLYGLWPAVAWEQRVERFAKAMKTERQNLPLNTQCQWVRRKDRGLGSLTDESIAEMFRKLDHIDVRTLSSEAKSSGERKAWELKVEKGWNYRTIHDWALYVFYGEDMLSSMTLMVKQASDAQLDALLKTMEEQMQNALDAE